MKIGMDTFNKHSVTARDWSKRTTTSLLVLNDGHTRANKTRSNTAKGRIRVSFFFFPSQLRFYPLTFHGSWPFVDS